ncbi:energy-converting hydrogenase B subunit P [Methanobacterium alcaliphilum]|uniref:energy-converting hydrogenase B subunit P n=1 Tax=Methanobacterium alcaliphilum TaxID=392018 RepID=UPI00200B3EDB|nr:energy-converting hydrogenase B subunit P [Methanobacterium alcaliphilum]MCK9151454.1 energy-converting hydrogenase B subunit P [Methanobacterium alcaliphilum]
MKFVVRPHHIISLGGYIVEVEFPYRNIIVVNPTPEPIKIEIPVFTEDWIQEHQDLGLDITPVKEEDNYLRMWRKEKARLEQIKSKILENTEQ